MLHVLISFSLKYKNILCRAEATVSFYTSILYTIQGSVISRTVSHQWNRCKVLSILQQRTLHIEMTQYFLDMRASSDHFPLIAQS